MMLSGCLITRFNKEMLRDLLLKGLGDYGKHSKCLCSRNSKQLARCRLRARSLPVSDGYVVLPSHWQQCRSPCHLGQILWPVCRASRHILCFLVGASPVNSGMLSCCKSLQNWHGCSQLLSLLLLNQAPEVVQRCEIKHLMTWLLLLALMMSFAGCFPFLHEDFSILGPVQP